MSHDLQRRLNQISDFFSLEEDANSLLSLVELEFHTLSPAHKLIREHRSSNEASLEIGRNKRVVQWGW